MRLFLLRVHFYFFQYNEFLKSCLKQPQLYLKSQRIEIKFSLKILEIGHQELVRLLKRF